MKSCISLFLAAALSLSLCACGGDALTEAEERESTPVEVTDAAEALSPAEAVALAYHEMMYNTLALLNAEDRTGYAAVTFMFEPYADYDEFVICRDHIPEEMQAESPEEVRYILRCEHKFDVVGYVTTNGQFSNNIARRVIKLTLSDAVLKEVLAETEILGSDPVPIAGKTETYTGDYPDEGEVNAWVAEQLRIAEERRAQAPPTPPETESVSDTPVSMPDTPVSLPDTLEADLIAAGYTSLTPRTLTEVLIYVHGYSEDEAAGIAAYCDIDWNEKAEQGGREFLDSLTTDPATGEPLPWDVVQTMSLFDGLNEYLATEGFTEEAIQYAVKAIFG